MIKYIQHAHFIKSFKSVIFTIIPVTDQQSLQPSLPVYNCDRVRWDCISQRFWRSRRQKGEGNVNDGYESDSILVKVSLDDDWAMYISKRRAWALVQFIANL